MQDYVPARLGSLMALAELLEMAATEIAVEMRKRSAARRRRVPRGGTLRPGIETPLWQAVAAAVRPHLRRRGARALLARELGLHRARVGEFFGRRSAMPDAERTLLLLLWLAKRLPESSASKMTRA